MNTTKKLYDNCEIYGPNDKLLGHCNFDKFDWYLKRGLADLISEKKLKLKFLPKDWSDYPPNLVKRENICVNCRTKQNLTKHHIIPRCYIKHFPLEIKSNNSHDVVLLCDDCHSSYEQEATLVKKELAEKYDAPLDVKREHVQLFKAYSCLTQLMILQRNDDWEQSQMILNMMHTVESYYPEVMYTDNDVKHLREKVAKVKKVSHGKLVMDHITDYQEFAEMWRLHFIETMEPAFMPESWDYKTNIYKCNQ